jgi:hypothetical protein
MSAYDASCMGRSCRGWAAGMDGGFSDFDFFMSHAAASFAAMA